MRAPRHSASIFVALVSVMFAPGCFAVANIDRFDFDGAPCSGTAADVRDYNWRVTGLSIPHPGKFFEMHVVDNASGRVAAAIVYDGIPDEMQTVVEGTLTDALTPGQYQARFWADRDGPRTFEVGMDHAWIESVPDSGCFAFVHASPFGANVAPTDDPAKGNAVVRLTGVGSFMSSPLIIRVRTLAAAGSPEVGYYRLDSIPTTVVGAPDLILSDIAENDSSYFVHAFVDMDRDGSETPGEPVFDPGGQAALPDAVFALDLGAP